MAVAMVGRFFVTYAMNAGAQISLEVCPTELRGQGSGLANLFAQATTFFSPYIVYSVRSNFSVEMYLYLGISLKTTFVCLFVTHFILNVIQCYQDGMYYS